MISQNPPALKREKPSIAKLLAIVISGIVAFIVAPIVFVRGFRPPDPSEIEATRQANEARWQPVQQALDEYRRDMDLKRAQLDAIVSRLYASGLVVTVDVARAEAQVNDLLWAASDFEAKKSHADFLSIYCHYQTGHRPKDDHGQYPIKIRSASSGAILLEKTPEGEINVPHRF